MQVGFWGRTLGVSWFVPILLLGCVPKSSSKVCQTAERVSWEGKHGNCSSFKVSPVFTENCPDIVQGCGRSQETGLLELLACLEALPVCMEENQDVWRTSWSACLEKKNALTDDCANALALEKWVQEGVDPVDASTPLIPEPIADGGHGVELVALQDGPGVNLSFSAHQAFDAGGWCLYQKEGDGGWALVAELPSSVNHFSLNDAGKASFYVRAMSADGGNALGIPWEEDGGGFWADAGCLSGSQCFSGHVCDFGTCREQLCRDSSACPSNYDCFQQNLCYRSASIPREDGGLMEPPVFSKEFSRELVSEKKTPTPPFEIRNQPSAVAKVDVRSLDLVAFDSAQQFIALEQAGQIWGYYTNNRGKTFRPTRIDTLGSEVRLAFSPKSGALYACYNVGYGTRLRVSLDLGRTWETRTLTFEDKSYEEGLPVFRTSNCDIAPWKDGQAMFVTVDGEDLIEALTVRVVTPILELTEQAQVFTSELPPSGEKFGPQHPSLATLPEVSIAHLGYTAARTLSTGRDSEVYGLYRAPETNDQFVDVGRINETSVGKGNPFPQDHVTLAISPKNKLAIAAFTSAEVTGKDSYNNVYVSVFDEVTRKWFTGSGLSVFHKLNGSQNFALFCDSNWPPNCERSPSSSWDAFSPSFAITSAGQVYLSFMAGPVSVAPSSAYSPYVVGLDADALLQPTLTSDKVFVSKAKKIGSGFVSNPAIQSGAAMSNISTMQADDGLSAYLLYMEIDSERGINRKPVSLAIP